jgi:membrane-associated phospholipid phosphatase
MARTAECRATAGVPHDGRVNRDQPLGRALVVLAGTGIILVVLGVIVGLALIGRHGGGPVQHVDDTVWRWSIQHRGHLVGIDKVIATVGDAALLGPLCVVLALLMFAIRRSPSALAPVMAYLGGEGLVTIIRAVIHRNRPATADYPAPGALRGVHETSYSFPSGHAVAVTAVFFALFGLLALTRHARWPWLLALCLAAFVADSRLLLGVHWFSDVAIGMALGIAWGAVVAVTCAWLSVNDRFLGRRTKI